MPAGLSCHQATARQRATAAYVYSGQDSVEEHSICHCTKVMRSIRSTISNISSLSFLPRTKKRRPSTHQRCCSAFSFPSVQGLRNFEEHLWVPLAVLFGGFVHPFPEDILAPKALFLNLLSSKRCCHSPPIEMEEKR